MTLILDCFARNAAFQVSDRRLTDAYGGAVVDDQSNKAVVVNGRVVFGYTGLATIDGQRADLWLAQAIADGPTADMKSVANRIREKATAAFSRLRCPTSFKRHAFRGTGWFRLKDEDGISPGLITVHNCFDYGTGDLLPQPLPEFKVACYFPTELRGGCFIRNVGVTPSSAERSAIFRLVRKCCKNRHATRGAVLQALIRSVQWLSAHRGYTSIGSNLIAVCIPKAGMEKFDGTRTHRTYTFVPGNPQDNQPTFLYVNAEGFMSAKFSPIFVGKRSTAPDDLIIM